MSLATHAVRAGAGGSGLSTSTLALAGFGVFCMANPEKALQMLQRALLMLSESGSNLSGSASSSASHAAPAPIVIHAGGGASSGGALGGGIYGLALQLSIGAGLCWGSYALLINVLPEQAKNMLPVTQGTFKTAVTSLGKGLVSVKESLSAELASMFHLQSELQHKQDDTHEQVLYVQDQVSDVHDDLGLLDSKLDSCQARLAHQDKRTTYIARGIRLVTAGMTALLPEHDALVQELQSFSKHAGDGTAVNATVSSNGVAPRNKTTEDEQRRAARRSDGGASQASASRRSRSSRRSRNRPGSAGRANRDSGAVDCGHKSSAEDTLSVSTGTPIRNIVIPRKTKSKNSSGGSTSGSTICSPELKELEEVRALLERMDDNTRRSIPMM